jgi:hypothetical protein
MARIWRCLLPVGGCLRRVPAVVSCGRYEPTRPACARQRTPLAPLGSEHGLAPRTPDVRSDGQRRRPPVGRPPTGWWPSRRLGTAMAPGRTTGAGGLPRPTVRARRRLTAGLVRSGVRPQPLEAGRLAAVAVDLLLQPRPGGVDPLEVADDRRHGRQQAVAVVPVLPPGPGRFTPGRAPTLRRGGRSGSAAGGVPAMAWIPGRAASASGPGPGASPGAEETPPRVTLGSR